MRRAASPPPDGSRGAARLRAAATALVLASLAGGGCAWLEGGSVAERKLVERRVEQLRKLVRRATAGPLFGRDQLVLVVHQRLVQQVLTATLPWEAVVRDRYRVRVHGVECRFEDDLRLLRLDSRVAVLDTPGAPELAELRLYADLVLTELDPHAGRLRGRVSLVAFEVERIEPAGSSPLARVLIEELGRLPTSAFLALTRRFEVPLRLERELAFRGTRSTGALTLRPGRVALGAAAAEVRALSGRLWVALDATPGAWDVPSAAAPARGPPSPAEAVP